MNRGKHGPARSYDGVVLRIRKNSAGTRVLTVFTAQKGLIRIFAGTVKQTAKQGGSPFLLLSDISFEAWEKDGGYTLSEYECRNSRAMLDLEWQTYVYSQIFTDIALALLPEAEADMRVFALLRAYCAGINTKDVRTATIVAGWQLVGLAGLFPDPENVYVYRDGRYANGMRRWHIGTARREGRLSERLSPVLKEQWESVCSYTWERGTTLRLTAAALQYLEEFLYSYVSECSERELKSLQLLC